MMRFVVGAEDVFAELLAKRTPSVKCITPWNMRCAPGGDLYYRAMPTTKKKAPARKPNSALMKPVQPDEALAKIVGSKPLPRGELTKKLWDYIKKNKLQDAKKRTQINADDALKAVFNGKKSVSMFEMTKLVSGHLK